MRKKTVLQELVYPSDGLPEVLIKRAICEVENKHPFYRYITFERVLTSFSNSIKLRLEVFGEGLLEEAHLTWATNDLKKELHKANKMYLFLKEIYGLEPRKPWWRRLLNTPSPELY